MACDSLNKQQSLGISTEVQQLHHILAHASPVPMAYQVFIANFTSNMQIDVKFNVRPLIHLGLCLPASCDSVFFYTSIEKYFKQVSIYGIQEVSVQYHKTGLDEKWALWTIPEFYLLFSLGLITIGISVFYKRLSAVKKDENGNAITVESQSNESKIEKEESEGTLKKLCSYFSIEKNRQKLFNTKTGGKEIGSINGIR